MTISKSVREDLNAIARLPGKTQPATIAELNRKLAEDQFDGQRIYVIANGQRLRFIYKKRPQPTKHVRKDPGSLPF